MTVIFVQSRLPADVFLPPVLFSADKLLHLVVFGILGVLCYISLIHIKKVNFLSEKPIFWSFIICSLYGVVDELNQLFTTNRSAEFADWLADVAGVSISCALIKCYLSQRFKFFRPALAKQIQS